MRKLLNLEHVRKNDQNIAAVRKALVREDPEYTNKLVEKFNYSGVH